MCCHTYIMAHHYQNQERARQRKRLTQNPENEIVIFFKDPIIYGNF